MIEWAILASATPLAAGVLQGIGEEYVNTQGERGITKLVNKVTNRLKTQTPAENHELAKAFRRACIVAAQNIIDSRRTTQTGQSRLAPQHSFSTSFLGETPKSLFTEDEGQWLEKANQYLKDQIDQLNQDVVYLPEKNLSDYQHLINPKERSGQIWANQFQRQLTKDMIAELTENAGSPSESIKFEIEKRWFFQASNEFQKALGENQLLANKFQNNMLVHLDAGQEEIMRFLQRMVANFTLKPSDLPELVGSLVERSLFVNRKTEKENLENWLTTKSKKIIVIEGISGYGKTSLLMEVLHKLSRDGKSLDEKLDAVLIFLCREGEGTFREVCKKADERLGKNENNFLETYEIFLENTKDKPDEAPADIIKDIIEKLKALGNVWLVFDNFETVLENQIINQRHLQAFFEKALQLDGLHFLLTSQKVPEFRVRANIEEVGVGILPETDALQFFKEEGKRLKDNQIDCGLAEIEKVDLEKLKNLGFEFVPMAMVALVGYLQESYPRKAVTLPKVLEDEELFAKFREYDAKEGAMYLIGLQFQNSGAVERLLLKALSIFKQAIEYPALVKILEEHADEDTIFGILMSNSLIRRIEPNYYELLPQAKEAVLKQPDRSDEALTRSELHHRAAVFYDSIRQPIANCYTREEFEPYFNAIDHYYAAGLYGEVVNLFNEDIIKLCNLGYMREIIDRCLPIKGKFGNDYLEANNHLILGIALDSLGRLNEAVEEYDKAIEIREELVTEKDWIVLANDLATAYLNKGVALDSLGRSNEAIVEYDKAIKIFEELATETGYLELANGLAKAYLNKGVVLFSLSGLKEAIVEYDKAIEIFEELVKESGRNEFANDLAMSFKNKGITLWNLGKLNEAVEQYDKAIEISEELIKEKGRIELANELTSAYMSKGLTLEDVPDLENALVCLNEGIVWREKCLARGENHVLPDYVEDLAHRVRVLIKLEDWQLTANDVVNAFNYLPLLESPEVPDYFKQRIGGQLGNIIRLFKEVSPENREEIYKNAGEMGEVIRQFVDGFSE